jgi:carboxypeptidase C (cathepsin A)
MKTTALVAPLFAALTLLGAIPTVAQEADPEPSPSRWESHHAIDIQGQRVEYDAVVGSIILRGDEDEATAELFYTAYFRTNVPDRASRPVIFAYNGGPGSASFWLHMGIMGPRRVVTPEVGPQGAPPYPLEDNDYALLDMADIVMVDPVGTGFSLPVGDTPGSTFWGSTRTPLHSPNSYGDSSASTSDGTPPDTSWGRATARRAPPCSPGTSRARIST